MWPIFLPILIISIAWFIELRIMASKTKSLLNEGILTDATIIGKRKGKFLSGFLSNRRGIVDYTFEDKENNERKNCLRIPSDMVEEIEVGKNIRVIYELGNSKNNRIIYTVGQDKDIFRRRTYMAICWIIIAAYGLYHEPIDIIEEKALKEQILIEKIEEY